MATSNIPLPLAAAGVSATGWATVQDWEKNRELISDLYERMTLPKVMDCMKAEHGFKAT